VGVRRGAPIVALVAAVLVLGGGGGATAGHMQEWTHDHSRQGVPPRPDGYAELRAAFGGGPCNAEANDARTWFPHAYDPAGTRYIYYHPYLAKNVGGNIRKHIQAEHRDGALNDYLGAYNCRQMTGSTNWSTHAWGAAVDVNWVRNPYGSCSWDGVGGDGRDHGRYLPEVWKGPFPGHRFKWGIGWCDPHHFQYVTGY
jgi:hypothetical protein